MKTAHFTLDGNGKLITLGVGENTVAVANELADLAESVALSNGTPIELNNAILDISDLYRLKKDITEALNGLDNDELAEQDEQVEVTITV